MAATKKGLEEWPTSVRLPLECKERIEKVLRAYNLKYGFALSRSDVVRRAITVGLPLLEEKLKS